jgi:hypothetical protein
MGPCRLIQGGGEEFVVVLFAAKRAGRNRVISS